MIISLITAHYPLHFASILVAERKFGEEISLYTSNGATLDLFNVKDADLEQSILIYECIKSFKNA